MLAITVGTVAGHVTKDDRKAKLRQQLIKYSEFPLDEVKEYDFGFKPRRPDRKHPLLIFTRADIERVRRQARTVPVVKAEVERALRYIAGCGGNGLLAKIQKTPDGWKAFYQENYRGNALFEVAPLAYLGSDERKYGILLAAGVKGMAQRIWSGSWKLRCARPSGISARGSAATGCRCCWHTTRSPTPAISRRKKGRTSRRCCFSSPISSFTRTTGTPTWDCAAPTRT